LVIANFSAETKESSMAGGLETRVALLPRDLKSADIAGRTVVVFDVLRATTTMTAALAAGVSNICIFDNLDAARLAARAYSGPRILCGEINCLKPDGFDLGNSPSQWNAADYRGLQVFMSTTNGTRAIVAAAALSPAHMLAGAIVNAAAVANAARKLGRNVTLLCSGTNGEVSLEDALGAGAVLTALLASGPCQPAGDAAQFALRLFAQARNDLPAAMHTGAGGLNLIRANLDADIDFCARLDVLDVVGHVGANPLSVSTQDRSDGWNA
jgi:2-phosphosulfolactate phosphatase